MRLTGPRPESGAAGPDGRAGREEGDTLLPGGALVEELRRQVEVLEALRARPPAGPEGPDGLVTTTPPEPVRFGPTTFAPPPAPMDFPSFEDLPGPETSLPEPFAADLPEPEMPAAPVVPTEPVKPALQGTVKIKSSSAKKPRSSLFARKTKASGSAAPAKAKPVKAPKEPKKTKAKPAPAPAQSAAARELPTPQGLDDETAAAVKELAAKHLEEGGPKHTGRPLGELLLGRGLVSEDQLKEALTTQTGSGKRLGNILVELGLLTERALVEVLAEQLQVDIVELSRLDFDPEVVTLLSEHDARNLKAVPIAREGERIVVAVADPLAEHLQEALIGKLNAPVQLRFATATDIEAVVNKMHAPAADLGDALRMFEARLTARKSVKETESTVTTTVDENAPVVKVVNVILEQAVRERASDVHIEPMEEIVRVRVRTDGALHEVMTLPAAMGASLISRIKVMSDMNIVERRKPQDGQLAISLAGRDLDVRVSTTPTVFGEKCVLRVLDKTKAAIDLAGLGMDQETSRRYTDLIKSPYGMVICAGPTGSGKTTTLYATLGAIYNDAINVVTIEDPVEYVFPQINQIQINEPGGLTFASGLRAILRQDPDSILVGEIRDVETARIAVQAALTGHFVMSSLHATDSTSALHRFMDMGIEPFLVASSLLGVVGQRLVRKLCPHCSAPYEPTPEERAFYERGGGNPDKTNFVFGAGCNFCGQTGYYDRIGIYEVLAVTDELKELIVSNAPHAEIKRLAGEQGLRTLRDQAIQLVTQNKTTIAEVLRTVYVL
jgi:type IV pilus assembly protein PilB